MFKPPPEPPPRRRDTVRTTAVVALAFGWAAVFAGWLLTVM